MRQETDRTIRAVDRAILATGSNAKAIQAIQVAQGVVERKLEGIEQILHKLVLSLESSAKEGTPVP